MIQVEVCCASLSEALAADRAGVDSVELCAWLPSGGVTPSMGLVREVLERVQVRVRVLVRCRPGDFHYTEDEQAVMLRDVEAFGGQSGVGLVVGALDAVGRVDRHFVRAVQQRAPIAEVTFHRAIDGCRDPLEALASCRQLGVQRVLTSGAATLAMEGVGTLSRMICEAGEVRLAAAGGIGPGNVVDLVESTGVKEVHFAAQRPLSGDAPTVSMSSTNDGSGFTTGPDEEKIAGVLSALHQSGLR